MRDEGKGNGMVEGRKVNAFSLVKCDCLCKHTELFLHGKSKRFLYPTRCFSNPLVPFRMGCLFSIHETRLKFLLVLCSITMLFLNCKRRQGSHANGGKRNLTFSLVHHTMQVHYHHHHHHHHTLMVIIVQLFKLNTPPLFSAHLFVCICARPASLTYFPFSSQHFVFLQTPTLPCLVSFGSVIPSPIKRLEALSKSVQHRARTNSAPLRRKQLREK